MYRIFLLFLLLLPSLATAEIKRLAVLEFSGIGVDENLLLLMGEEARSGIIKVVDRNEILVMTRESMMLVLQDMGKDASCIDGTCEVEIARNIGADYVISGAVVKTSDEYVLTLKLHESETGRLLASNIADATNLNTLRKSTSNFSRQLMAEGFGGVVSNAESSSASGFQGGFDDDWQLEGSKETIIHFDSEPKDAIVMLDSQLLCQSTPCSKQVSLGGHQISMQKERYKAKKMTVELKKGEKVSFQLDPDFGYLNVSSSETGISILLDGKNVGKLPLKGVEIAKGSHVLSIEDKCYLGKEYHFSISSGETETVAAYPVKARSSGIRVSVLDKDSNAKEAKIYVDGRYLGLSPLTEKVDLCSRELVVEVGGQKTRKALSLEEKQVEDVEIVLGGEKVVTGNGYKAVLIPSGTFQMGCTSGDSDCYDWEKPVHKVTISRDFYLMESEVSQGLYESVMGSNPSHFKGSSLPVEKVSWYDAVKFANKLSAKEGLEQCYSISGDNVSWSNKDCNGWRLPTEAEWEYASRGNQSYKYAGSSSLSGVAWYSDNSGSKTHNVCGKQKNGYGLCDMSGNVWEWVWDWYDVSLYGSHADRGTVRDPYGANSGSNRVGRGGSWGNDARGARVSLRKDGSPGSEGNGLGFRLGRTP